MCYMCGRTPLVTDTLYDSLPFRTTEFHRQVASTAATIAITASPKQMSDFVDPACVPQIRLVIRPVTVSTLTRMARRRYLPVSQR